MMESFAINKKDLEKIFKNLEDYWLNIIKWKSS